MIVLGLAGIRVAELHGNLTMTQRLEALERFKSGDVEVLVATDLAARGLDITVRISADKLLNTFKVFSTYTASAVVTIISRQQWYTELYDASYVRLSLV
jgi:excinuclease UvrABC helicase subunit UvrB